MFRARTRQQDVGEWTEESEQSHVFTEGGANRAATQADAVADDWYAPRYIRQEPVRSQAGSRPGVCLPEDTGIWTRRRCR